MNTIALHAESALLSTPHPALRLSELLDVLAGRLDRGLTAARLRASLEDHPERFRILEAWRGRWRAGDDPGETAGHTWVVVITDPGDPPDTPKTALKLRDSVRWLGRGLDGRSRMAVSRWYAIALAERATREAVVRRAA
jgi:hypothetical protein